MKQTMLGQAISQVTKLFLAPMGPLQHIFDSPGVTHVHCLEQAYAVLRRDSKTDVAMFFQPYHSSLTKGLFWADQGWKNVYHFYSKPENEGHALWPGATAECQYYFNKALAFLEKDIVKGMFFLGAALHLVQDMCVPHHSVGVVFDGHQEFEKWATQNWARFPALRSGDTPPMQEVCPHYKFSHPSQFIDYNAEISARYYPLVSLENGCTETSYIEAARYLLPLTVNSTAGFLDFACDQILKIRPHLAGSVSRLASAQPSRYADQPMGEIKLS